MSRNLPQFPSTSELNPPKNPFSLPEAPSYSSDTKVPPLLDGVVGYVPPPVQDDSYWISLGRNGGIGPRDALELSPPDDLAAFSELAARALAGKDPLPESFSSILSRGGSIPDFFPFSSPNLNLAYRRPDFDAYYSTPRSVLIDKGLHYIDSWSEEPSHVYDKDFGHLRLSLPESSRYKDNCFRDPVEYFSPDSSLEIGTF